MRRYHPPSTGITISCQPSAVSCQHTDGGKLVGWKIGTLAVER